MTLPRERSRRNRSVVHFLTEDDTAYLTGALIPVNGGSKCNLTSEEDETANPDDRGRQTLSEDAQ
jgi:hypothetical protein